MFRRVMTLVIALFLTGVSGCQTHQFLNRNANKQAATLTDIVNTQVLDNLAMFSNNPDSLPHFAIVGDGTTQAYESGQATMGLTWNPFTLVSETLNANGQRALQENWKLQPVMSAGRLLRIQCAYRLVVLGAQWHFEDATTDERKHLHAPCAVKVVFDGATCGNCIFEMIDMRLLPAPDKFNGLRKGNAIFFCTMGDAVAYDQSLRQNLDCRFPRAWYCSGRRQPKGACYVGKHCDTHVWVDVSGVDALTRFAMTVLVLAANDPLSSPSITVRRKYDAKGESIMTEVEGVVKAEVETYAFPEQEAWLEKISSGKLAGDAGEKDIKELVDQKDRSIIDEIVEDQDLSLEERLFAINCLKQRLSASLPNHNRSKQVQELLTPPIQRLPAVESSPFDRPGNSPFSRGSGGIEVGPGSTFGTIP